jgi:hypothetical protein
MNYCKSRNVVLSLFLILLFGGCKNPIVQDILRDASVLENISITDGDQGTSYSLTPIFSAETTAYTVTVPFETRTIVINGWPDKDGKVTYRRDDGASSVETSSGVFDFPEDQSEMIILIQVIRPYMDPRTYTLTVIHGADSLLRDIELRAGQTAETVDHNPRSLSPGFVPETSDYTAGVPSLTEVLRISGKIKPGASITYKQYEADGVTAVPDPYPEPELFAFPPALHVTKIKITVSLEGKTESYWLTARRPEKVKASSDLFTIVGGQDDPAAPAGYTVKYFNHGEPVVVRAKPPFGTRMAGVERCEMDDSGNPVLGTSEPLTSETGLYAFVMPGNDVIVTGTSVATAPVPGNTVLYVRGLTEDEIAALEADPSAIPSGDGSSWEKASLNLQNLMDNTWSGQEIWISAGRVRPDWTGVTSSGWASDLDIDQVTNKRNWGFVLKEGVKIYGGFEGTETAATAEEGRDLRNPALRETVLSGNLGEAGNVKHVVIAVGVSAATWLEGLTISGGKNITDVYDPNFKINGQLLTPSPGIYGGGGGLININASPWLHNVIIKDNTALHGGAIFNWNSSPVLINITVSNCVTAFLSGNIYNDGGSDLLMIGGSVSGNRNNAVFVKNASSILISVTIRGNSQTGVHYDTLAPADSQKLINVTVTGNDGFGVREDHYPALNWREAVFNSVITGNAYGSITGLSGTPASPNVPVNSTVDGVGSASGSSATYWPVRGGAFNQVSPYNSGGYLRKVYERLSGLPGDIQDKILNLLGNPPSQRGAK